MTTCCRSSDIKSSVYNQTGEGFFQQLTAYNHMSAHLRRVLLAKSRVDSRNPSYSQKQQRGKNSVNEKFLNKCISQEFIDRLAYDTEHHPMEILRMNCNFENRCDKYCNSRRCTGFSGSYMEYLGTRTHSTTIRQLESDRSRSMSRSRMYGSGPTFHSARPGRSQRKSSWRNRDEVDADGISSGRGGPKSVNSSIRSSPRTSKIKNENDPGCSNYASSFESSSETSRRGSPIPNVSAPSPSPVDSMSSTQRQRNTYERSDKFNKNDEKAKYSKFLYDITEEIVQQGLYTDEELKNVFKKHVEKNLQFLDKSKMMYELYQLKLSLNIIDQEDDEEDENIEQFIRTQKLSQNLNVKPPTPPKVLDENKFRDKLMDEDELQKIYSKSSSNSRNAVVLVDANPELLISERDILATLMEMNIEPKQAQNVFKRLQKKSKEFNNVQLVHPEEVNMMSSTSGQKVTPELSTTNSINPRQQHHRHNLMNTNKYYNAARDKLIINRDSLSLMKLKFPYREKRRNPHLNNYITPEEKKSIKSCRNEARKIDVSVPHCSDSKIISSGHLSTKEKSSINIKNFEMKNKKDKAPREISNNQSEYTSRKIPKRKTSSLSQLEGLQSNVVRSERMKKKIEVEIKNSDRDRQSTLKLHATHYKNEYKDIETGSNLSTGTQVISQINKEQNIQDSTNTLFESEIEKIDNSSPKITSKSLEKINKIQNYISYDSSESIAESIDDSKSINEENPSHIVTKLNMDG